MKQNKANPRYPKLSETGRFISTGIITLGLLFTASAQQDSMKLTQSDSTSKAKLYKNYPNPFMPTTTIKFSLDSAAVNDSAVVNLYNFNGKLVWKKIIHVDDAEKKHYIIDFDATDLESGVYNYELIYKGIVVGTNKMVLVK